MTHIMAIEYLHISQAGSPLVIGVFLTGTWSITQVHVLVSAPTPYLRSRPLPCPNLPPGNLP